MRIEATRHIFHRQLDKALSDESRQDPINQDPINQDFISREPGHDAADSGEGSRALVITAPAMHGAPAPHYRPATFLAHLIATRDHAPQTRERRRAEPADAIAAYRATAALTNH